MADHPRDIIALLYVSVIQVWICDLEIAMHS
jgi:hypothetical protein